MDQHRIFLIGGADEESGLLSTSHIAGRCRIDLSYRGRAISAEAADYFEALCDIRRQLEKERLIPFCYGASLNVYPSGMARDMGAGRKAYKLTFGKHARPGDLVDILAEGPDIIPAYVDRQKEYFEEWLSASKA